MASVTRFICEALDIHPPQHDSELDPSSVCWLCGGVSGPGAWPLKAALPGTFTQANLSKAPDAPGICAPCAAVISSDVFKSVAGRYQPGLKLWSQCGWHSYSHFIARGVYEAPNPARFRELMLDPPSPCVFGINTTGKKHTLFRGGVTTDPAHLVVQFDEETIRVRASDFRSCLADIEALSALGFSKDGIETGNYHPESLRRAGIETWRKAEEPMRTWRADHPTLVMLAVYVCRSWKWFQDNAPDIPAPPEDAPETPAPQDKLDRISAAPTKAPAQGDLFG